MDCSPINRLRLKDAFSDNQKFLDVKSDNDYLLELFEHTDRGTVFIHDDDTIGHSVFIKDTGGLGVDKTLMIENKNHDDLFLWHIDGVLYPKDSKCDCAFLSDGHFGRVEFKANAVNKTEKAIKDNYEKAKSQLSTTYKDIKERCANIGVDLCATVNVEAYAVFNRTVPKNSSYQKKIEADFSSDTEWEVILHFENSVKIS